MYARVRSPGWSESVTASAAVRRTSRVGGEQPRERDVERDRRLLVGQVDLERGDLLAEQPRPRARAGDALLGHDLLLGLAEQVGAVAARGAQVVARRLQPVAREELLGVLVGERGPFEVEEHELRLDRARRAPARAGSARRWRDRRCRRRSAASRSCRRGRRDRDRLQLGHRAPGRAVEVGDLARVGRAKIAVRSVASSSRRSVPSALRRRRAARGPRRRLERGRGHRQAFLRTCGFIRPALARRCAGFVLWIQTRIRGPQRAKPRGVRLATGLREVPRAQIRRRSSERLGPRRLRSGAFRPATLVSPRGRQASTWSVRLVWLRVEVPGGLVKHPGKP